MVPAYPLLVELKHLQVSDLQVLGPAGCDFSSSAVRTGRLIAAVS